MMSVPFTAAFMIGWRLSVATTAWMMKGRNVSFCPVAASNSARVRARTRATRVRSISKNVVTCAATRMAMAMCSDVRRRIFDIGSTTSPGHAVAAEAETALPDSTSPAGRLAGIAAAALAPTPPWRYATRSLRVTRPATPEPDSAAISTPCSAAMRRTRGELLVRTRSSKELPLPAGEDGGRRTEDGAEGAAAGVELAADSVELTAAVPLGAGGGAILTPFSVSMRATMVCTATVTPSPTTISAITPLVGDGISASTLSVEISKMGSSRLTSSPTFFNHRESVPSAIDSPICGITTSTRAKRVSLRIWALRSAQRPHDKCRERDQADHTANHREFEPVARGNARTGVRVHDVGHELRGERRYHTSGKEANRSHETPDREGPRPQGSLA